MRAIVKHPTVTFEVTMSMAERDDIAAWYYATVGIVDSGELESAPIPGTLIELAALIADHRRESTPVNGDRLRVWLEEHRDAALALPAGVLPMMERVAEG